MGIASRVKEMRLEVEVAVVLTGTLLPLDFHSRVHYSIKKNTSRIRSLK